MDDLHALMIGVEPDLTLLIDMDPAKGLDRALARQGVEERFEDFGEDLQKAMRAGFLTLAAEYAGRFRVIDGARSIQDVAQDVAHHVQAHLGTV